MNFSFVIGAVLLGAALVMLILAKSWNRRRLDGLRKAGVYPEKGRATDADVARLKAAGETILAVRCYREIHGVGLAEAHAVVTGKPTPGQESPPFHFPSGE